MEHQKETSEPVVVTGGSAVADNPFFGRQRMVLYIAIFAILGIIALLATNALTPNNGDFEAENMTVEAL